MKNAHVFFKIEEGKVLASLAINGFLVVESISVREVAHLLRVTNSTHLTVADGFTFPLPADSAVLAAVIDAPLAYPLTTFCLISECSWSDEEGSNPPTNGLKLPWK